MTATGDWRRHLEPGETLVWTGQPVRGFVLTRRDGTLGAVALAIGLVAFVMAFRTLGSDLRTGVFWLLVGMLMEAIAILPPILLNARLMTRRYAVTDRRALVLSATGALRAVRVGPDSVVRISRDSAEGGAGSVAVAQDAGSAPETFHRIADAAHVADILRGMTRQQRPPSGDDTR